MEENKNACVVAFSVMSIRQTENANIKKMIKQ